MEKPSILFLGAGAVGGYYGGRLQQHDAAKVTFLVREARKALLDRDGLRIESPHGNVEMKVDARTADELHGFAPDYLILTAKAYDLDNAIQSIQGVVGPQTTIVPLLNGIRHLDTLNAAFGAERVLGGTVSLQVEQRADGVIWHRNQWQIIGVGEQKGGVSARVERLAAAFSAAGMDATASPAIMKAMWEKIVMLATLAGLTTLFQATLGEISRAPGGREIALSLLDTNAATAAHAGFPQDPRRVTQWRSMFTDEASTLSASMLADMRRNGPVEADHIVGFMLERAREAGCDVTLPAAAYANLKIYEARRAAAGA